jgi:LPS-assembly protein
MQPPAPPLRLTRLAFALGLGLAAMAAAAAPALPASAAAEASAAPQAPAALAEPASELPRAALPLVPSITLQPLPRGAGGRNLPIVLRAKSFRAQPDLEAVAEGDVEFRRGGLVIRADRLAYDTPQDLARAKGHVRVSRDGAVYSGPELELRVQRFEGFFLEPRFEFPLLGAGGRAARIDFIDPSRSVATQAAYTSCPRDDPQEPAWVLQARKVTLDLEVGEGLAEGAVLRFLGTPILAWPSLSFPLGDQRKSGWLPPSLNIDSRSGVELAVPYYWNIAPNRDATLAPRVITRRGLALDAEFRYLEARDEGSVGLDWLPNDRVAKRQREAVRWNHDGRVGDWGGEGLRYRVDLARVSDNDWWKDFPNAGRSLTTRLLPLRAALEQPFNWRLGGGSAQGLAYGRLMGWQVLQASDSRIASPYQRSPQIGARLNGEIAGWQFSAESEYNRFTLPTGESGLANRPQGQRLHLLGSLSRAFRDTGLWLVPRLSLNAAAYDTQANALTPAQRKARAIPTLSVDAGFELERRTSYFGRGFQQTLEPRLLYVNTPYRAQSQLPNYDSAGRDFNIVSIYTDNAFSGVDRVADAHQLTAGVTTRLVDTDSGAEALRLGFVQRYLLRTQRVAPQADGSPDGAPLTQRFSDALLIGSTSVLPGWTLDSALQYSPDISRTVRSISSARYSPGPFRTVGATYRLARGLSEQLEIGWQWPIAGLSPAAAANEARERGTGGGPAGSCSGAWYSVGRLNYSLKDTRITDAVVGVEYDAGCWIGRVVAERLSTGRSEATTRLLFQLELVGLSRIGSNPLKVLKDNIPGYRLLRDDRGGAGRSDRSDRSDRNDRNDDWQPTP